MRWIGLALVLGGGLVLEGAEPVVSNVRAAQRAGTIWVDITYDMEHAGGWPLEVTVEFSEDEGMSYAVPSGVLTGDVGGGISPGLNKRVVWEADASWLGLRETNVLVSVRARWHVPGLVWIAPGSFMMGSPAGEQGRFNDEGPQTEVRISGGYWLGQYEVTQREWELVMGSNPSHFKGADLPVESVSWEEAMEYCRRLTEREREAGRLPPGWEYRLPTEAEWEYACRAGTETRYSFGDDESDLGRYGWYSGNSNQRTHPVGQKEPNGRGLYDMHGNVWEWCLDWYARYPGGRYPGGSVSDPTGPASGSDRVFRGGCWYDGARYCRSAYRDWRYPSYRHYFLGFRVALVQVP